MQSHTILPKFRKHPFSPFLNNLKVPRRFKCVVETVLLFFLVIINAHAEDVRISHCNTENQGGDVDCGKILIGAARVQPNTIQWVGSSLCTVEVGIEKSDFGITGATVYNSNQVVEDAGKWNLLSTTNAQINNSPGMGPSIGFFFSPLTARKISAIVTYTPSVLIKPIKKEVQGEGIQDGDGAETALTLDFKLQKCPQGSPCVEFPLSGISCPEKVGCEMVHIDKFDKVVFYVVPRVNTNSSVFKANGLSEEFHKHVRMSLEIAERDTTATGTNCLKGLSSSLLFKDYILTSTTAISKGTGTNITADNYLFDYLGAGGPRPVRSTCDFSYPLLVRAYPLGETVTDAPFVFQSANNKETGKDYVDYRFSISGHYGPAHPEKWKDSHKTFRLTTAPPPASTNPTLTVNVIGTGSETVTSNLVGINNCSSNCATQITANTSVTLTAASNDTVGWSSNGCNIVEDSINKTATVTVGSQSCTITVIFTKNTAPVATKLTVEVKGHGNVTSKSLEINCPTTCEASFTENEVTLTATPDPITPIITWSGSCKGKENEIIKTSTVTMKPGLETCTVSFTAPIVKSGDSIVQAGEDGYFSISSGTTQRGEVILKTVTIEQPETNVPLTPVLDERFSGIATVIPVSRQTNSKREKSSQDFTVTIQTDALGRTTSLDIPVIFKSGDTEVLKLKLQAEVLVACFEEKLSQDTNSKAFFYTLDAACSGSGVGYEWKAFNILEGEDGSCSGENSSTQPNCYLDLQQQRVVSLTVTKSGIDKQVESTYSKVVPTAKLTVNPSGGNIKLKDEFSQFLNETKKVFEYSWWLDDKKTTVSTELELSKESKGKLHHVILVVTEKSVGDQPLVDDYIIGNFVDTTLFSVDSDMGPESSYPLLTRTEPRSYFSGTYTVFPPERRLVITSAIAINSADKTTQATAANAAKTNFLFAVGIQLAGTDEWYYYGLDGTTNAFFPVKLDESGFNILRGHPFRSVEKLQENGEYQVIWDGSAHLNIPELMFNEKGATVFAFAGYVLNNPNEGTIVYNSIPMEMKYLPGDTYPTIPQ